MYYEYTPFTLNRKLVFDGGELHQHETKDYKTLYTILLKIEHNPYSVRLWEHIEEEEGLPNRFIILNNNKRVTLYLTFEMMLDYLLDKLKNNLEIK